jgi:hypothetical protein
MAAARATARRAPSALLDRAVAWAELQFETALDEALRGPAAESFLLGAGAIAGAIAGYSESIGDVEQAPPGVEEAVDPLLRRDPTGGGFPDLTHLPGNVDAEGLVREPAASDVGDALTQAEAEALGRSRGPLARGRRGHGV